ncbi:hypothetical protein D3C71_970890 [compost metagenome]
MVVRQGQRRVQRDTRRAQRREEAFRVADAGRRRNAGLPCIGGQRARCPVFDVAGVARFQPHAHRAGAGVARVGRAAIWRADVGDDHIHLAQAAGRFPQGAGGQQPAVAHAALILHHDFHITGQGQVLQAVVGDNHVHLGVGFQQGLGRQRAFGVHGHRGVRGARNQCGFVAKAGGLQGADADSGLRADLHAVAPADHAGRKPTCAQRLHGGNHHGRLAGTANIDVAHHHDGHGGAVAGFGAALVGGPFSGHGPRRQGGQGQQQGRQPAAVLPLARQQRRGRTRGAHREVWAAKLTRPMPASRAASMMLITD